MVRAQRLTPAWESHHSLVFVEGPRAGVHLINHIYGLSARIRAKEHVHLIVIAANRPFDVAIRSRHRHLPRVAIGRRATTDGPIRVLYRDVETLNVDVAFLVVPAFLLRLGRFCNLLFGNGDVIGRAHLDGRLARAVTVGGHGWWRHATLLCRNQILAPLHGCIRRDGFHCCARFLHLGCNLRCIFGADETFFRDRTVRRLLLHNGIAVCRLPNARTSDETKQGLRVDAVAEGHAHQICHGLVGRDEHAAFAVYVLDQLGTACLVQGVRDAVDEFRIALCIGKVVGR